MAVQLRENSCKQKGLNVEDSDMETGKALIQLTLMSLYAASTILLLHLASKEQEPQPIKQTFTVQEVECLTAVNAQRQPQIRLFDVASLLDFNG